MKIVLPDRMKKRNKNPPTHSNLDRKIERTNEMRNEVENKNDQKQLYKIVCIAWMWNKS